MHQTHRKKKDERRKIVIKNLEKVAYKRLINIMHNTSSLLSFSFVLIFALVDTHYMESSFEIISPFCWFVVVLPYLNIATISQNVHIFCSYLRLKLAIFMHHNASSLLM